MHEAPNHSSSEMLIQSLRVAQGSGLVDVGFGLMILLTLVQEGRLGSALVWWTLLAVAVVGRMVLARQLLANDELREAKGAHYTAQAALAEALIWAGGLVWVPIKAPWGAALQIVMSAVLVVGAAFIYSHRLKTWLAYVVPLAIGQAVFLFRLEVLATAQVLAVWVLTLALAAVLALGVRRMVASLLVFNEQAQAEVFNAQHTLAEMQHSREQLHLALEALGAGFSDTVYESDKRYYAYSTRYAEILGYRDRDAFLATHRFSAAVHPDDRRRVLDARKAHRYAGMPFKEKFRMRRADGSEVWVQGCGSSLRDEDGRATRFVLAIVDITEQHQAELALAHSARQYRALLNASPSLIWTCDAQGRLAFVSERACRLMYGYAPRDVVGRFVTEFNAPGLTRREFLRRVRPVLRGQPVFDIELQHLSAQGEIVNVTISALPNRDENGHIESVVGVVTDITALKARERELSVALRNQQALFDSAGEGIAFVRAGRIDSANRALAKMLGVTRQWLDQRPVPEILASPEVWEGIFSATVDAGQIKEAAIHEVALRATGQLQEQDETAAAGASATQGPSRMVWCQLTSRLIQDSSAASGRSMILVLTDITALKRREELAWYQANHDELTGLPNRRQLVEHARRLLSVALRQNRLCAVLVLDLDGFKAVNDVLGHANGDALLRRVAMRFSSVLREYDIVARTGGDEFVALLPEIESEAVAVTVGEKMIAAATETLEHPGGYLRIHASVGLALFPADAQDFDALVQRADAAMYAAKAGGKNQLRLASDLGQPAA